MPCWGEPPATEARVEDYNYYVGDPKFPDRIELCGRCARRLFRVGPERRPYCEKCGHGNRQPPVSYLRAPVPEPAPVPESAPVPEPAPRPSDAGAA